MTPTEQQEQAEYVRAFRLLGALDDACRERDRLAIACRESTGTERESNMRQLREEETKVQRIECELSGASSGKATDAETDSKCSGDELVTLGEAVAVESEPERAKTEDPASEDIDAEIAALFDPVAKEQLEAMFPDGGNWSRYAERAARNGLADAARVARSRFNPYRAARWWMESQAPTGWKWERCARVLANNLPPRSLDSKHLLTGDYD